MNRTKLSALALIALAVAGCGDACDECARSKLRGPDGANHGPGRLGGVVVDLGGHRAEIVFDHDRWECIVAVVSADDKAARPLPVAASSLTLTTREAKTKEGKPVAPMRIPLMPADARDGKASRFVGRDPGLGNAVSFAGTVTGAIDGTPVRGEYRE